MTKLVDKQNVKEHILFLTRKWQSRKMSLNRIREMKLQRNRFREYIPAVEERLLSMDAECRRCFECNDPDIRVL